MNNIYLQQTLIAAQTIVDSIQVPVPEKFEVGHCGGFSLYVANQENETDLENGLYDLTYFEGTDKEDRTLFYLKEETYELIRNGMGGKEAAELLLENARVPA